jgi:hypothetical protein
MELGTKKVRKNKKCSKAEWIEVGREKLSKEKRW